MEMTLRQEAAEEMALLPEEDIQRKQAAFKAIVDMRERSPFPADFDYDRARTEALTEKYGRFA